MPARNRGKEASDDILFGNPKVKNAIAEAVGDVSYLLGRGYSAKSSVTLAGARYKLNVRQQKALRGMAASSEEVELRQSKVLRPAHLVNKRIDIDGFNLLILLETAHSGGYLFKGIDGAYRDLSSVHGSYKRVTKTMEVLKTIGDYLQSLGVGKVTWYFDTPVSNSGRLKTILQELAEQQGYTWQVELVYNPDKVLASSDNVVISSDAFILNECKCWFNIVEQLRSKEWTVFEVEK